jgi:hypothetical protein
MLKNIPLVYVRVFKKKMIFVKKIKMKLNSIALIFSLFLSFPNNAQSLSKDVREDFCKNAVLNYEYGTNMFKDWMNQSARAIGIQTPYEIEEAVQNIATNQKLQEEFLKNVNRLGGNKDFKIQQFTSIGMTVQHAKLLVEYIYLKYNNTNTSDIKKDVENDFIKETNKIKKHNLLKLIFPNGIFINDSIILQKQNFISASNSANVEIEFKTEVVKQISYTSNDDEERILVVLASYNNTENKLTPTYINTIIFFDGGNSFKMLKQGKINFDNEYKTEINYNLIFEGNKPHFVIQYTNKESSIVKKYYSIPIFSHEKTFTSTIEKQVRDDSTKEEIKETTKCKVYKNEAWIYSKNSFKNTTESQSARIVKLTKGTIINVIIDWEEEPKEMVKVIYIDKSGKKHTGFMLTTSLEFLNAG